MKCGSFSGWICFFDGRMGSTREGTAWEQVLRVLTLYRLISPGSEWRLHRHWFASTALADILGEDGRMAQDDTLYRCHDLLLDLIVRGERGFASTPTEHVIEPVWGGGNREERRVTDDD